jgi:hypothetical protein
MKRVGSDFSVIFSALAMRRTKRLSGFARHSRWPCFDLLVANRVVPILLCYSSPLMQGELMMRTLFTRATLAAIAGLSFWSQASLAVTITTFDDYNPNQEYAGWSAGNNISGLTAYTAIASGFGGAYKDLIPNPNALGGTQIQLDVTVNAGDLPNILAVLGDADGTEYAYRWFEVAAGNHLLVQPLAPVPGSGPQYDNFVSQAGGVAGLDLANIDFLHIQIDAHGSQTLYSVAYNDLSVIVPEPTTMGLAALGLIGLAAIRRRS